MRPDPCQRDAHECIGADWFMAGNLTQAEGHIAALTTIGGKCEGRDDLLATITRYKARKK